MNKKLSHFAAAISFLVTSNLFFSHALAAAYWPFNTPVCLASQVVPWNTLPGTTAGDTSYGIKIINHCNAALSLVEMDPSQPWIVKNIYPLDLIANGATLNGIGENSPAGSWNTPFNQASASTSFPYIAGNFQLYGNGTMVPYDSRKKAPWVSGDSYHMTTNPKAYWAAITLNNNDWFALNIATSNPGNIQINYNGPAPTVTSGTLNFTQAFSGLQLPAGSKVYVDLDFSKTEFSYLGTYRWDVINNPSLQLPVSALGASSIKIVYTVEGSEIASLPKGFTWDRYIPATSTKTGDVTLLVNGASDFPKLDPFKPNTKAIKLQGIIGLPFKEGGATDGTNDDLNKLNSKLTGTVLAFANIQSDGTIDVEPMNKTTAQLAAYQQNYQQFQNNQHVLLISFGGEAGGAGAEHIVSWGLKQLGLNPTQTCTISGIDSKSCQYILEHAVGNMNYTDVVSQSAGFYETVISRYKPDGIDLDIEGDDTTSLGSVLTAVVIKKVLTDVKPENPNFILGLTVGAFQDAFSHLQYNVFEAFANQAIIPTYINGMYMALPLTNWANLPNCPHFTSMPATPDGACLLDTIRAYQGLFVQYFGATSNIIPGITPMTLHDPSSTVEIWPSNDSGHPDQLGNMLSAIQQQQAAKTLGPVLFAFWDTRNDFDGGFPEKSYTSDQYQNELANYSSSAFVDNHITWLQPNLTATATSQTIGNATWSETATDDLPAAHLTYTVSIDNGGHIISQSAGNAQFDQLTADTTYTVTITVTDDQDSPESARSVQFKTPSSVVPTISWQTPNLVATATSQTSGQASWSENATDTVSGAKLTYTVSIDNSGVVQNQTAGHATFTNLAMDTTYTVTVKVTDDQGSTPVTKTTTFKTPGSQPTGNTITWNNPELVAAATSQTTGVAIWNETATDTASSAKLTYNVTIDQGGVIAEQSAGHAVFSNLLVNTTYNITVTVNDDQGSTPVSYSTHLTTSSTPSPGTVIAPQTYMWSPKAGNVGEFKFASAIGGTPPYRYALNITPTGKPQKQSENVYWIYNMTYYQPYKVSITVIDAAGHVATSPTFTIVDTN